MSTTPAPRPIEGCAACAALSRSCISHTCPDCGQATAVVHGSPDAPGPCPRGPEPEPGAVVEAGAR